jgi:hypothetical protein
MMLAHEVAGFVYNDATIPGPAPERVAVCKSREQDHTEQHPTPFKFRKTNFFHWIVSEIKSASQSDYSLKKRQKKTQSAAGELTD